MTLRERILAVYRGETPDVVPFMLDLSHWFYHKYRLPWDLSASYEQPEYTLLDYHKSRGIGFYLPNLASFFSAAYTDDVTATVRKETEGAAPRITWELVTPVGSIRRTRIWEERNYAWGIADWGLKSENDLRVLTYAMQRRTFAPKWDNYKAWDSYVGDTGVVYAPIGYSGIGHLLNYWLGIEGTMYAVADWPDAVREAVDAINRTNLDIIDLLAESPADIILLGDNISSDVQPPHFWNEWSLDFYREAASRLHARGKYAAVHIDGKLRGALDMVADSGADCADAVTPVPMGDLTPKECRAEAGPDFILSGGVSPNLWLPDVPLEDFKRAVISWLELRRESPRLIAAAGDQVPPGADEGRIEIMRDLVEEHGRY